MSVSSGVHTIPRKKLPPRKIVRIALVNLILIRIFINPDQFFVRVNHIIRFLSFSSVTHTLICACDTGVHRLI